MNKRVKQGDDDKNVGTIVGVGLTHTYKLMIRSPWRHEKPVSWRWNERSMDSFWKENQTNFEIQSQCSWNILITYSGLIFSCRTSAICKTADMSFKTRLEAKFKREYQTVELFFRQKPGSHLLYRSTRQTNLFFGD